MNALEKKLKGGASASLSYEETAVTAIGALQGVLNEEFKAKDLEVGVVRDDGERAYKVSRAPPGCSRS